MSYPFRHHNHRYLGRIALIALLSIVIFPLARMLPSWAGTLLAWIPLILLIACCVWMGFDARRKR